MKGTKKPGLPHDTGPKVHEEADFNKIDIEHDTGPRAPELQKLMRDLYKGEPEEDK